MKGIITPILLTEGRERERERERARKRIKKRERERERVTEGEKVGNILYNSPSCFFE